MRCPECAWEQEEGTFCGRCGAQVPTPTPTDAEREDAAGAARSAAASPRRPTAVRVVLVVLVVAAVVLVGDRLARWGPDVAPGEVAVPTPTVAPGMGAPSDDDPEAAPTRLAGLTDHVLVFDDGQDGALALDVATGEEARVDLPGQRGGDQPFRLLSMGGWLVVGWGEVHAIVPGGDRRLLGAAAYAVPDADPRRVWLVGAAGEGTPPRWRLVEGADADVVHEVEGRADLEALRGVPGGLAVRDDDGVVWRVDPATAAVEPYLGDGPVTLFDATVGHVAWCPEPCPSLSVTSGDGTATIGDDDIVSVGDAWLSGDGAQAVAAVVVRVEGGAVDVELRSYDTASGDRLDRTSALLPPLHGGWSPDGEAFYWYHEPTGALGLWTAGTGFVSDALPRDARRLDLVVLPRTAAPWHPAVADPPSDAP